MKTNEGDFDNSTLLWGTFPKEIHERDLPNVIKVNSPGSDDVQLFNEFNELSVYTKHNITADTSAYAFVVVWQMYG